MKVNSKSYPHPVLGNEDDIGGSFGVDFRYELGKSEIVLNPVFSLQNKTISDLVKKGRATFIVEVECNSTFYRRSFSTQSESERIIIPAQLLRQRVTVGFYICAAQDLKDYQPSESHPDYAGATFDVEKGDVLALGGYCSFIAEKAFDPLRPPVSSFMSIMVGDHHEGPVQLAYDSDKIMIILSKADWQSYMEIRVNKAVEGMLHASIVLPVLVAAIHEVRDETSQFSDRSWFERLEVILEAKSLEDRDPYEAAQRILDNPLARGFSGISSLFEITNDQQDD